MQKNMMKNEVKYGELIGSNQKNSSIVTNMQRKERGIFKTAKDATLITKIKEIEEQAQLSYADKKMEELAGGEKVTIDKIVNELKEQGYNIIQKVSGANTVTGIELSNKEITMDKNATASLTYTLKYESGIIQYFAEIGGKYYEITMDGDKIKVNTEASDIGEQTTTPPAPTITLNKENIITAEIGENGTIKVNSSESYGEVEITIACGGERVTFMVKVELPENSTNISSGTQVKKPNDKNWDETRINSYADGEGNTIPVPKGFTPIPVEEGQGTKNTGFVIRDTSKNEDGTPTETNANEFVWVPVEGMSYNYSRYDFGKQVGSYSNYSETMPEDEQTSIEIYGGYYIGRYESGIAGYTGGKLVVQKDKIVWNNISRANAIAEASRLYNEVENNIKSKLCSSYGWDTALKFIETQNSTYPTNSVGGYYGKNNTTKTGYDTTHPCNIYDMGGNVREWTTESNNGSGTYPWTRRGGRYNNEPNSNPAGDRGTGGNSSSLLDTGFRVTLYM